MTVEATGRAVRALLDEAAGLAPPGRGATAQRHLDLAQVARTCTVSVARLYEAHTDALAILAEAGLAGTARNLYGVWASEGGPAPLRYDPATRRLDGVKPFCSGLGVVDRALVTAAVGGTGGSVLLDVCVRRSDTISMSCSGWGSHALADTATGIVEYRGHPANEPIGWPDWYLDRPGFWHGACGPAACWAGGAMALVDDACERVDDDPHRAAHRGSLMAAAWSLRALLVQAGNEIDRTPADVVAGERRARSLRWTVERDVTDVIDRYGRAFGPRPQVESAAIGQRMADLQLYLRQHHAERELAVLARLPHEPDATA